MGRVRRDSKEKLAAVGTGAKSSPPECEPEDDGATGPPSAEDETPWRTSAMDVAFMQALVATAVGCAYVLGSQLI